MYSRQPAPVGLAEELWKASSPESDLFWSRSQQGPQIKKKIPGRALPGGTAHQRSTQMGGVGRFNRQTAVETSM